MVRHVVERRQRSGRPREDVGRGGCGGRGERLLLEQVLKRGRVQSRVTVAAAAAAVVLMVVMVIGRGGVRPMRRRWWR